MNGNVPHYQAATHASTPTGLRSQNITQLPTATTGTASPSSLLQQQQQYQVPTNGFSYTTNNINCNGIMRSRQQATSTLSNNSNNVPVKSGVTSKTAATAGYNATYNTSNR